MYRRLISPQGGKEKLLCLRTPRLHRVQKAPLLAPEGALTARIFYPRHTASIRQAALLLVLLVFYVNLPKNA